MCRWFLALSWMAIAFQAAAAGPGDLLDPKDAFRLSVKGIQRDVAEVEFRIAPGYYLYRDRFRFETDAGKQIAEVQMPTGKIKVDAFFGRTETYRDRVRIRVPLAGADIARKSVRLKVISQGCADLGVCYVPQEQVIEVRLDN